MLYWVPLTAFARPEKDMRKYKNRAGINKKKRIKPEKEIVQIYY